MNTLTATLTIAVAIICGLFIIFSLFSILNSIRIILIKKRQMMQSLSSIERIAERKEVAAYIGGMQAAGPNEHEQRMRNYDRENFI